MFLFIEPSNNKKKTLHFKGSILKQIKTSYQSTGHFLQQFYWTQVAQLSLEKLQEKKKMLIVLKKNSDLKSLCQRMFLAIDFFGKY